MSTITETHYVCDWCGAKEPDESEGWKHNLPVTVGDNPAHYLDLCPTCLSLVERAPTVRIYTPRTGRRFRCSVCGRVFATSAGRNIHAGQVHKNA